MTEMQRMIALTHAADDEITSCIDLDKPKSFYLFSGAGTGKTRSLVVALTKIRIAYGQRLLLHSKHVGVITYTNAACDEITRRIEHDPLFEVSTIHSFAWTLIAPFTADIRRWIRSRLVADIEQLTIDQSKGRLGTKASIEREASIRSKERRLLSLDSIKKFVYSPTGENRGRDALNHSEIISITADFLKTKEVLQNILVDRFPILLIDESQDTNRHLMDALLLVQAKLESRFCLGLFGDSMQRIYADGKAKLIEEIPDTWVKPVKHVNFRCPERIITLLNRIRLSVDGHQQVGSGDVSSGVVRLFIVANGSNEKAFIESRIADKMAALTSDTSWSSPDGRKTLILEHHMAARRMGFDVLFTPLYRVKKLQTGLLDGTLPGLRFFCKDVLPLVSALRKGDRFKATAIIRNLSPLLNSKFLRSAGADQGLHLEKARGTTEAILSLWKNNADPSLHEILQPIAESNLLEIPDALKPFVNASTPYKLPVEDQDDEDGDETLAAWREALTSRLGHIELYDKYIRGQAAFDTHQGVKGLEFPNVMVIIDDEEARGFLFSYDKLFGAKGKSDSDIKNEAQGLETTIDRTSRLFYVTCSRAEQSLAIVAYTSDVQAVRSRVIGEGWFSEDEIEILS